jgi:hypothetical protein
LKKIRKTVYKDADGPQRERDKIRGKAERLSTEIAEKPKRQMRDWR